MSLQVIATAQTFTNRFTKFWPKGLPCAYGPYRGFVQAIHDGDTITVLVDAGFVLLTEVQVRIYGIQAPELQRGTPEQRASGIAATQFLSALLPINSPVRITTLLATSGEQTRTFVRYVAQVEMEFGDIATKMVGSGHAFWCDRNLKPLPGPPLPIKHWTAGVE